MRFAPGVREQLTAARLRLWSTTLQAELDTLRVMRRSEDPVAFLAGRNAALGVGSDIRPTPAVVACSGIRWI